MKVIVTGSNGLIGQDLTVTHSKYIQYIGVGKGVNKNINLPETQYLSYDLTLKGSLYYLLSKYSRVEAIVHCAAFTDVDKAEVMSTDALHAINVDTTKELCNVAKQMGVRFVFLSTDYVFDGVTGNYKESDPTNPINAYAKSKVLAEEYIMKNYPDMSTIIRTSTPFTDKGHEKVDFARWVYNSLKEGKPIKVVTDQISNPTYIPQLSNAIAGLIGNNQVKGICHITGDLALSRFDLAKSIAKELKLDVNLISPITTAELNQLAKRPLNTILDTTLYQKLHIKSYQLPLYEGFNSFLKNIKSQNRKSKKK